MKQKKFIFLLNQSLASTSSIATFLPLAKELHKKGHQINVLTLHHNYFDLSKKRRNQNFNGVKVKYVGQMHVLKKGNVKSYFGFFKLVCVLVTSFFKMLFAAMKLKYDYIYLGKPQLVNGAVAYLLKIFSGKPLIICHDDFEGEINQFKNKYQQGVFRFVEKFLIKRADYVAAVTTYLMKYSKKLCKGKVFYMSLGFDQERLSKPNKADLKKIEKKYDLSGKKIVSFIGSMSKDQSVPLLIDAFEIVAKKIPNAVLFLVGGGKDFEYIKNYADKKSYKNRIIFTGMVPYTQIRDYLAISGITVDPVTKSLSTISKGSTKIIESLRMGKPIVTVDYGDRKKFLENGKTGAIVGFKAEDYANGIIKLLNNEKLRKRMGEYALEVSKKYNWKNKVNDFLREIEI